MNTLELTCMLESDPVISRFNPKVLDREQFSISNSMCKENTVFLL